MQLFMKQKVFSWKDRFTVKDQLEADRYMVEGELFSWGKKLRICRLDGSEAAFIQQKVFSFLPKFFVYVDGVQVAEIVKEFTFFRPKYSIHGLDWTTDGDFLDHEYQISKGSHRIADIHKAWLSWADCYAIDINEDEDEVLVLAVVLAIDCVLEAAAAASSAAATSST